MCVSKTIWKIPGISRTEPVMNPGQAAGCHDLLEEHSRGHESNPAGFILPASSCDSADPDLLFQGHAQLFQSLPLTGNCSRAVVLQFGHFLELLFIQTMSVLEVKPGTCKVVFYSTLKREHKKGFH